MAKGMGCYFHPETQSVAQCLKCGKGLCRNCVDRYSKINSEYTGLCRDCILEVGIQCKDHPSKQADVYCEKCGDPICADCHIMHKFCYKCTTDTINSEIAECENRRKIDKMKPILVAVFSAIGLIIGLAYASKVGLSDGSWVFILWLFLGIGGNFRVALSEFPQMYRMCRKDEADFLKALGWTLFLAILFLFVKSLAGPIIPILKIREYLKNVKIAESIIADNTDGARKLADYHAYLQYIEKHGDNVDLAKLTEQGGVLYNNAYANAVLNGKQETYMDSGEDHKS